MSRILRGALWVVATLAVAAAVHVASVQALPHLIMGRAMAGIARSAGGVNRLGFAHRPDATSRGVVRPSPDLLYASCVYDLDAAGGAVWVQAHDMPHTYWSVSLFDADTNNFYVLNDRQAKKDGVDFVIVAPGGKARAAGRAAVVAPTRRGLVLFRVLIDDEAKLKQIDAARRHASCEPDRAG